MRIDLNWKAGFEIELSAPNQSTRENLARSLAQKDQRSVERFFHPQSEPSKVVDHPTFENLTQGFRLLDSQGKWLASFVDDLTLQADFNKATHPLSGWYRIVSDDYRFLRLVIMNCNPNDPPETVLEPLADLFGTAIHSQGTGMYRVSDDRGNSVAICASLPGERERPCEIVTAPITSNHHAHLAELLDCAKSLGFLIPKEGATHIHYDADPLCSPRTLARLVRLFTRFGDDLKMLVGVNPNCVRLGAWPSELQQLTASPSFQAMTWPDARQALTTVKLTKFCDFNLWNIARQTKDKHTFEVRILPSTLDAMEILHAAALFESLLTLCCDPADLEDVFSGTFDGLLSVAAMPSNCNRYWQNRLAE
jgi:hypothetical protein